MAVDLPRAILNSRMSILGHATTFITLENSNLDGAMGHRPGAAFHARSLRDGLRWCRENIRWYMAATGRKLKGVSSDLAAISAVPNRRAG